MPGAGGMAWGCGTGDVDCGSGCNGAPTKVRVTTIVTATAPEAYTARVMFASRACWQPDACFYTQKEALSTRPEVLDRKFHVLIHPNEEHLLAGDAGTRALALDVEAIADRELALGVGFVAHLLIQPCQGVMYAKTMSDPALKTCPVNTAGNWEPRRPAW